jgi:hypothetical protein
MKAITSPFQGVTVSTTHRTLEERAALGEAIYDRQVCPTLRPEDKGKFVAIDVETGDFEMDEDDYTAVERLQQRKPDADTWLMCVGYPTTYRLGAIQ